jgi:hypothetical protein
MSDVTDLLDRLAAGTTTLDDVVRDFEKRDWPTAPDDKAREAAALAGADPEPIPEGSFAEVSSAYVSGQIDDEQYAALATAAAGAMSGQPQDGAAADDPAPAEPQKPVAQTS